MQDAPIRIVQISDIHHFAGKDNALLGVKTHDSFKALLDVFKKDPTHPSFILLTGDLSQDGSEASYIEVADMMKDFPVPAYWIPGNHDDGKMMAQVYPRETISNHKHIVLEHWHIILLDSHKPGCVEGYLDPMQLKFMQHCLELYPEHHAIIVFHHQPILVGCEWLDNLGLTNPDDLWTILKHYPSVHSILFGHVHQEHQGEKNGIKYYSVPSTCIQFKAKSDKFALAEIPPAYRWIDLYPNGELKTGLCHAPKYVGVFDSTAKGY